jgi:hypothetical protein
MLSLVPYLLFLYLIWRVWKIDRRIIHTITLIGFFSMVGFIAVTAVVGIIAIRVMNAETLGHVDYLHGGAEFCLTIVNGLIALGLKKQKDMLDKEQATLQPDDAALVSGTAADA